MKRYRKTVRHRKYIFNRSIRQQKADRNYALFRKRRNYENNSRSKSVRFDAHERANKTSRTVIREEVVTAPHKMCFLQNPEGMAKFIQQVDRCWRYRKPVYLDMSMVSVLELNAIAALLAVVVKFRSAKIRIGGHNPNDKRNDELLKSSGFFQHLEGTFKNQDAYELQGSTIFTHGNLKVDSEFSRRLIEQATQTVWNEKRRCNGLQRVLVELMLNTNNHASLDRTGEKHYWISVHHIKEENRVVFTFVDFGVGVFESLAKKSPGTKFHGAIALLMRTFKITSNQEVLGKIFSGDLHRTSTGKQYRGKGLPGIYEQFKKNGISNLALVTNDVFFDSNGSVFRGLRKNFSGTLIIWELNADNVSLDYIDQNC